MSSLFDQLLRDALELLPLERADLAKAILRSLEGEDGAEAKAAWEVEIDGRRKAVHDGTAKGRSATEGARRDPKTKLKMKAIMISSKAEDDISESVIFFEQREAGLGFDFVMATRKVIRIIQAGPEICIVQKNGTRQLDMKPFPTVVHYEVLPDAIWIIAFVDASRPPGFWVHGHSLAPSHSAHSDH